MMMMSDSEIRSSYKWAKNRHKQIKILSELNACPKEAIIKILQDGGFEVPEPPKHSNRKEGK